MKAAIYTRVSTEEQAAEGVSLDVQAERCRAYCKLAGLTLAHTITDDGVTTKIPLAERPGGRQLTDLLQQGKARDVIALRIDRLFRDTEEALRQTREWDETGIALHLVDMGGQAVDTASPQGRFFLTVLVGMAEWERSLLGVRVKEALQHIAEQGRLPGGDVFGYCRNDHKLEPLPEEAQVVRTIFASAAKGASIMETVRQLNAQGVARKHGGRRWQPTTVRYMLRNPLYTGRLRWRGELLDGNHSPLVGIELFEEVGRLLDARQVSRGRKARHITPLIRCGVCGASMRIAGDKEAWLLRCRARTLLPIADRHESVQCAEEKAIAVIWRHTELLLAGNSLRDAIKLHRDRATLLEGGHELRELLAEIDGERMVNLEAARRGLITIGELERENAPLMARREELLARLQGIEPPAEIAEWERLSEMGVKELLGRFRDGADMERQLLFLRGLYERVELHTGRRLRFVYVGGLRAPEERPLPPYYAPRRGSTDLRF